jgi:bifunctional non-homologous end joining protein LigD
MGLERYWRKRNFERTPEPHGEVVKSAARAAGGFSFVIQKHAASHLHYDFRLELDGTLKSWAIPKGPSLDPAERRLAVEVEDHPLAYGEFEGIIPAGEYGGGTVLLWDRGDWVPEDEDPQAAYERGRLRFRLEGEKLAGRWSLVRMGRQDAERHNWLLIKAQDEFARPDAELDITEQRTESVLTGRQMAEIAADRHSAVHSSATPYEAPRSSARRSAGEAARTTHDEKARGREDTAARADAEGAEAKPAKPLQKSRWQKAATARGAVAAKAAGRTALPEFLPPQFAVLVDAPPTEGEWLAEMKYDGYRVLARLDKGRTTLWTRNRQDWTQRFPIFLPELEALPVDNAWLDGEVIALDDEGRSSFSRLQQALGLEGRRRPERIPLLYCLFDLLFLNGHDLRALPQGKRKELLQSLLKGATKGKLRYSDHLEGQVEEAWRHACLHGEEGIVLKRADAPYLGTRSSQWLKLKCANRQEFVIGGWTDPEGTREQFGALLVGYHAPDGDLVYAGRVGTGFDAEWLALLGARLRPLARKTMPFDVPPTVPEQKGAHWVQPKLVAEVRFAGWTRLNRLRQAAFLGLREDKPADAVERERPLPTAVVTEGEADESESSRTRKSARKKTDAEHDAATEPPARAGEGDRSSVAGVAISHASRLLFPEAGVTKGEVARYYESVAGWLLPQLKDRPLTLVRCPQGLASCFFQKHFTAAMPESLRAVEIEEEDATGTYMTADSLTAVIELVQMGVLELHTWGARRDRLERPDRLIFDLDPAPDFAWPKFVVYARLVRELLQELGLPAFLKTTGGKGVHVEVPLQRVHGWDEVKEFAEAVANQLAEQLPEQFLARASKRERRGRIFVDWLRNTRGATAVAAYSLRARPGAPVAMPLAWEELPETPPGTFTLRNALAHLAQQRVSPWQDYEASRVRLRRELFTRLGLPP